MNLLNQSFEILDQQSGSFDDICKHIEICGRTCYKSTDKITDKSALPFVNRMIQSKHYTMLEHGTVYLILKDATHATEYRKNKYSAVNNVGELYYVTTNMRVIVENVWNDDLDFAGEPTEHHEKRVTVKFICNRQVSHEFVRHRVFSFAQESTRYCNYTKDKFGNALSFIKPLWFDDSKWYCKAALKACLKGIEIAYNFLVKRGGWKPQQAATILPNALKTELIMTGFVSDWVHYFSLRAIGTTGAPHPQAKELALPLAEEFDKRKLI